MTRLLLTLLTPTLLVAACCKADKTIIKTTTGSPTAITGTWKLVRITGGFASMDMPPGPGQNKSVTFRSDNSCTTIFGTDTANTTYSLRVDTSVSYQTIRNFVTIADNNRLMYSFAHDTMTIEYDGIADGTTDWLVRD